jgi:hypothetical protein
VTGATIETTTTPTYSWATAAGAASSILGLVILAMCIAVSASHRTAAGFAPIPYGTTALACCMTLGGLILLLFRILHGDRDEMMRRLEAVDRKLDNVWGIAAVSSIEAKPVPQQHTQRRGRRRAQNDPAENGGPTTTGKVVNEPSAKIYQLGIAEGLRRRKRGDQGEQPTS